jgi:hypothetical protein
MIYAIKIHTELNHMQNLKFRIIKSDAYITFVEEAAYVHLANVYCITSFYAKYLSVQFLLETHYVHINTAMYRTDHCILTSS